MTSLPERAIGPTDVLSRGGVLLSVIVPCFNVEAYLDACLASVRDQDLGADAYEIIVIDDGSTDSTLGIAERHAAEDPRITIVSQPNQGLSAARNAGLARATGSYVYFVDGDDLVASDSLREVAQRMRTHALEIARVGTRRVEPGAPVPTRSRSEGRADVTEVASGIDFLAERHSVDGVWQYVFDRAFLARVDIRFEVGRLLEDQLFIAGALAAARRVALVDQDVYRYRIRPGSIMRSADPDHAKRLVGDFEHVIHGFGELRQRKAAEGTATPAFLDRLLLLQQICAFFLIARIIRARTVPLRPVLGDTISRLRATGAYPLTMFPGADHPEAVYRILAFVFDRGFLLFPFAVAVRLLIRVTDALRQLDVRRTAIVLFGAIAVIAILGTIAAVVDPDNPWIGLDSEIDLGWPPSEITLALPAVWSTLTLTLAGIAWIAVASDGGGDRTSLAALGFGAVLLFLAGDELFILHERLEYRLRVDWQLLYAPFAVLGAALLGMLVLRLRAPRPRIAAMLAIGGLCWVVAAVLELVQWTGDEEVALYVFLMIPEELLELTGSALFALAGIALLRPTTSVITRARPPGRAR